MKKPHNSIPIVFSLSNGLKVIFYPVKFAKAISLDVYVRFGHFHGKIFAHFIEHLLAQGNRHYLSQLEISLEEEKLGIHSRGVTSGEYTAFQHAFPKENFKKVLNFLKYYLFYPIFEMEKIEKERKVLTQEYLLTLDTPIKKFYDQLFGNFFGRNHPYNFSQITKEDIKNLNNTTKNTLVKYFKKYYCPSNMAIGMVGDLAKKEVEQNLKEVFGKLPYQKLPLCPKIPKINFKKKSFYFSSDDSRLVDLSMLFPIPGWEKLPRKKAIMTHILIFLLGQAKNSRLYLKLREELSLIYGLSLQTQYYTKLGFINLAITCEPKNFKNVFYFLKKEIEKIKNTGVTKEELRLALKFVHYNFLMQFDSIYSINRWLISEFWRKGKIYLPEDYNKVGNQITNEDIKVWARKILNFEKATLGIKGNKKFKKFKQLL